MVNIVTSLFVMSVPKILLLLAFFLGISCSCKREHACSEPSIKQDSPIVEIKDGELARSGVEEQLDTFGYNEFELSDVSSSFSKNPQPLDIEFFSVKGNVVFRNNMFPLGDIPASETGKMPNIDTKRTSLN